MTTNPSANARNEIIGSNRTPERWIWAEISGCTTPADFQNFVIVTPIVISANAPSPWIVRATRKMIRPIQFKYARTKRGLGIRDGNRSAGANISSTTSRYGLPPQEATLSQSEI